MKIIKTNKSIGEAVRAILSIVFIYGLLAAFAFRQADTTGRVAAQTGENEVVASPESTIQSFSNPALITINDNTTASPYPSTITVSGVNPAYVTNVRVSFTGFSHPFPDDLDIMLRTAGTAGDADVRCRRRQSGRYQCHSRF